MQNLLSAASLSVALVCGAESNSSSVSLRQSVWWSFEMQISLSAPHQRKWVWCAAHSSPATGHQHLLLRPPLDAGLAAQVAFRCAKYGRWTGPLGRKASIRPFSSYSSCTHQERHPGYPVVSGGPIHCWPEGLLVFPSACIFSSGIPGEVADVP